MTILFAYDGSESADGAIASAAKLLEAHDADALVLAVWEPLIVEALRAARFGGPLPMPPDLGDQDERAREAARRIAEHGARVAGELGFDARPVWVADQRKIADAIVEDAAELDVDLIVLGARGLTGVRAFLGSVSNHVLQNARRPVLVVPPTAVPSDGEAPADRAPAEAVAAG
jgi:nucleotide-binding universal stress UspA family protein